ncbi:NADAR family protein [Plantactinospora soyae]|uniref:NAD-dependent protein-ADP-ribosyltransferase YbiA (DUF1768 family) n=1 Tax=Plantactinospora soyae TaxID=1544732 RepID=A0A927M7P5_9ACTN|nr:NADAR family protein [Plantactinospora soyae]MBE1489504.1 putative NAD-dependent protein-ADP-ribosyltransferase YbiA (DUF1768 family) [Plantactinospora soyae]
MQDDIILGPDFLEKVLGAIQRLPDHAIALFTEWGSRTSHAARVASLVGANWVEAVDEYVPTQALVMPAQACLAFDEFVTHELGPEIEDDDALLAFIRASRIPAVVAVPNLVEHRDLPSVAGNESHGARRSVSWSRDTPASLLGPVLANMPILPYFSWATGRAYCLFRAAPPYGWKRIPARDLALGWAFDEEGLTATLDTATGLISGASVFDCISVDTVKRLLLTAVVLGLAAQDTSRGPRFSECRMTSEAEQALNTFAPGALRCFVAPSVLADLADDLRPAIDYAVRAGLSQALAPAPDRFTPTVMDSGEDEGNFLDIFHPAPVVFEGEVYPSVGHAYYAARIIEQALRVRIRAAPTAFHVRSLSGIGSHRENWADVKLPLMRRLHREKFRDPQLRAELIDTGDRVIVNGSPGGGGFWGASEGDGENQVGRLLMALRRTLRTRSGA